MWVTSVLMQSHAAASLNFQINAVRRVITEYVGAEPAAEISHLKCRVRVEEEEANEGACRMM